MNSDELASGTAPAEPPVEVAVIGLGYVGLPTAAILASRGLRVCGVDVSGSVVAAVNAGTVPFVEPDLGGYVSAAVRAGNLRAAQVPPTAGAYIIAVPTPFHADRSPDLDYIRAAAEAVAEVITPGALVILESTSPPGTTQRMAEWILAARPDLGADPASAVIFFAHCPERVLPGRVMVELVSNDRIIGGLNPGAAARARQLYQVFCSGELLVTDAVTAELAKLVENSYRDVNIAFANELSLIADRLGVDVWRLIELANHHPRVHILQPGPGVGGHCVAVDPWFIVAADPVNARLIRTAREVNDSKPDWVVQKVADAVAGRPRPVIAALGLAFKPDIDDLRESPARAVVGRLAERFPTAEVRVVEPHVSELPAELAGRSGVSLCRLEDALEGADCIAVLVDHSRFRALTDRPVGIPVVDTRGLWHE